MNTASYPPPIDKLLTKGDCSDEIDNWSNYLELGLSEEHIPDLIDLATNVELFQASSDGPEVWGPIHAWRALGQLRAYAAIEPLMSLFHELEDSDWASEELPQVYGMLGAPALTALAAYLGDRSHGSFACITALSCLKQISRMHPDAQPECVAVISHQLELFTENDPTLNGFLISALVDLKAVAEAPTIERAFAANCVDLSVLGDWDDAQVYLGLKDPSELPKQRRINSEDSANAAYFPAQSLLDQNEFLPRRNPGSKAKAKARKKMAQKSRKQNRKRK